MSPRLDAEVLYRHAAGLDRTQLFLAMRDQPEPSVVAAFQRLVDQRIAGQPVAYLTGHREFMGLDFHVTPAVLIPRPETELLVEWALTSLEQLPDHPVNVVDVGSGSGAIVVSVSALAAGEHQVLAIEPSPAARDVIARNATEMLSADRRSRFTIAHDDLLSDQPGPFGMVLANLPYLTPEQIAGNHDLDAEPRLALDGGPNGLDLVNRLIDQLPGRLATFFAVGLEIDPSQSATVVQRLRRTLPGTTVDVIQDLAGLDRHVVATRRASDTRT